MSIALSFNSVGSWGTISLALCWLVLSPWSCCKVVLCYVSTFFGWSFLIECPGDARFSFGSRRHTPRECRSCKEKGPTSTAEKNKEEKGIQVVSAKGHTKQAVGHCCCPQQLLLQQPERNSVSPSLFVTASSGFQSMHSSNPKVRNSPSGNTQR